MMERWAFLFLFLVLSVVCVYSQSFVYEGCSQETYTDDSNYDDNLQSLLGTLLSQASNTKYYNATVGATGNDAVYGLYQCRGDLGGKDCQNCVRNAQTQISQVCVRTRGARIQMDGCSMHYDRVDFFGLADNSVIYKTCSANLNGGADFYAHLNAVLTGLQTGSFIDGNGFRLSNSGDSKTGYVHGLAQCEGDLTLTDCATCINAAVQRLKDVCSNSGAGQVYLSKCYARYAQDAFYRDHSSDHHDHDDDDAGKTVAIILGLLAGVALIVVFLSFLKQLFKSSKGHIVSPLDMASGGIHSADPDTITTLEDYNLPLTHFFEALPSEKKVILVGHSSGGFNLSLTMEKFPHKIATAVFVTAFMPLSGTTLSVSMNETLSKFGSLGDTTFYHAKGEENPPTSLKFGSQFAQQFALQKSPPWDVALISSLMKIAPIWEGAILYSRENYGSVRRAYVVAKEDKLMLEELQRKMIAENPPQMVSEIEGSDHCPFFCEPDRLAQILIQIANA